MPDPFDLQRFVQAQAGVHDQALAEIRAGRKRSHWMWFTFPQYEGLGYSSMAQHYAIKSIGEALAYLAHPVLGARLVECAETVLAIDDRSISEVFGYPDDLKLRSSVTLFAAVASPDSVFQRVIDKQFAGKADARTLLLINERHG
jgi:uncharacterized protein (DUF1810 family)